MTEKQHPAGISRFDPSHAVLSHNKTILAAPVVPEGYPAPFEHAWGYLTPGRSMESHRHPTQEIYLVIRGSGWVTIDEQKLPVTQGDVISIPEQAFHTMTASPDSELLWAALWWSPL